MHLHHENFGENIDLLVHFSFFFTSVYEVNTIVCFFYCWNLFDTFVHRSCCTRGLFIELLFLYIICHMYFKFLFSFFFSRRSSKRHKYNFYVYIYTYIRDDVRLEDLLHPLLPIVMQVV